MMVHMTDWAKIEGSLDDQTAAHRCAVCGNVIRAGDAARWGIAARPLRERVVVTWVHGPCFINALDPSARPAFLTLPNSAPPA